MSDRLRHYRTTRAAGQGGSVGRGDSGPCSTAWYVYPSFPYAFVQQRLTRHGYRLPLLLRLLRRLLRLHDLQDRAQVRSQEPPHLPFHLLNIRFRFHHVHQGFRYCA